MNYKEICKSNIKPIVAFVLIMAVVAIVVVLSAFMSQMQYRIFAQLALVVGCGFAVYVIYRYIVTEHTYEIDGKIFRLSRGVNIRAKTIAEITSGNLKLIAPCSYAGERVPKGQFSIVNCCSSLNGRTSGWCAYCVDGAASRSKVLFEPTDELLSHLVELFGEKVFVLQDK